MMDKPKILIIDDDEALCESVRDTIELEGYLTETAYTAEDGIKKVKSAFFNIVLLDMKLPDMDGIEILERIKAISPDSEIIIFTAYAETDSVIKAMDRNAFSYFPKPFEMPKLLTAIKKAYEKQTLLFDNRELFRQTSVAKKDWENTFDSITDLISIHDYDFNLIRYNKAFARKFKIKLKDLAGKKCYKIFHGTNEPYPTCPFVRCKETLKPESEEVDDPHMNGIFMISCFPRFDEDGKLNGIIHIAKDITEMKRLIQKENDLAVAAAADTEKKKAEELAKAYEKIQQKTKELQDKVNELEKLNRITMGREFRIAELKEEVARLKAGLARKD